MLILDNGLPRAAASGYEERELLFRRYWRDASEIAPLTRKRAKPSSKAVTRVMIAVPIGTYTHFAIRSPCGLASSTGLIGSIDDPPSFYSADRRDAQLLWFRDGVVEYNVDNPIPRGARLRRFALDVELCSDAALYKPDHPSDIEFRLNGRVLGTWTCPGDFGGRRGRFTPMYWRTEDTQYGMRVEFAVTSEGCFVNKTCVGPTTTSDVELASDFSVALAVNSTATNVGGLNLFGKHFGDHSIDPTIVIDFEP